MSDETTTNEGAEYLGECLKLAEGKSPKGVMVGAASLLVITALVHGDSLELTLETLRGAWVNMTSIYEGYRSGATVTNIVKGGEA